MVLLVIADHANDDGSEAWPSQATIAAKCSVTIRTVQRSVNTLVKHKYVYMEKRAGGSLTCREDRRPNRYTINMKRLRGDNLTGRQSDANEATITTPTGRQSRPMNHPIDTPMNTPKRDELFEEFWSVYPRKTAKPRALKAWQDAIKNTDPRTIIDGAKRYALDPHRTPKYTAYPATWLNGEQWADEPLPPENKGLIATPTRVPDTFDRHEYDEQKKNSVPMPESVKELLQKTLRK